MGSSGFGSFGDYRIGKSGSAREFGTGSGAGGGVGGNDGFGGETEHPKTLSNIKLEDVAVSEFFVNNNNVPEEGLSVYLDDNIYNGRLVVKSADTDEILGNLPTQYNYLITYLKSGVYYDGTVVGSGMSPIPFIVVNLYE